MSRGASRSFWAMPAALRTVAVVAVVVFVATCSSGADVTQRVSNNARATTLPPNDATATSDPSASSGSTPDQSDPGAIAWEEFDEGVDTATLDVPVDYADPDGPVFELFLARHRAAKPEERIGSLLVNPGGPGFGGSEFAIFAELVPYDEELLDHFDIVGWDPRGTGQSEPFVDCIDDYDRFFAEPDITPDTAQERAEAVDLAEEFADDCVANNADIIEHIGTNNSARDMDAIRRALGEETISFFGFSYGSELGATWATLFPDTVRAAVFDGASDPNADTTESSIQQLRGFESTLSTFLAECSADTDCAFHNDGDAEGAFDALMAELDEGPIPGLPDRPDVNRRVALTGVIQAMYSEVYWPALEESLADARAGDGSGLQALADSYFQRQPDGTYGNELEAFQAIGCADTSERLTVAQDDALSARYTAAAPRLAPEGSAGSYSCTFFPDALDPRIEITGAGAGPIVVVGTTGDPATPLDSTRAMAEALEDGRLVVVEADQHTGYNVNTCINEVVNDYLVDLNPPADGTECR
ncbi:MAG TPA: alpha/beta hydrolase [Ilumatobacteraceae bacterium]|nr:alpha/beta hydrolase [Ilumatobacteraceae bacterium]